MSGIARIQPEATLHPSKLELLAQWLPDQWWFDGDPSDLEIVAKFRFVDPDDVVGLDCMLVRSTDAVYHILRIRLIMCMMCAGRFAIMWNL